MLSQYQTSYPAILGLQALLEVNLRLATTGYLSNGYDDPQPGLRYRFCCPVRLYPSQRVKSHIAQHVVFSDVIVPGDQQRVRRYPPYRKFSADNAWNPMFNGGNIRQPRRSNLELLAIQNG